MKSLERRFKSIQELNQKWGDLICFNEAVRDQGFTQNNISRLFKKLIDKEDYDISLKRVLLRQARDLTERGQMREDES